MYSILEKKNGHLFNITMKKPKVPQNHFYKKVIKIPIYFGNFIIIFSDDTDRVARMINANPDHIGKLYGHTFHNFLYGGYESFCVCFNFWGDNVVTTGTLVHEVNHAANRLMYSREFEPDWNNDESECYLKGWMADEVEKFMRQCKIV